MTKKILWAPVLCLLLVALAFAVRYSGRMLSIRTIEQISAYDDYNLYQMKIRYRYDLDRIIARDIHDDASFVQAVMDETFPWVKMELQLPDFGCSCFTLNDSVSPVCMGRNYDFKLGTSCMLVRCEPQNGYRSIALAALNNVHADKADSTMTTQMACLTAPFICLDGMNEKGVAIAVLTLDSKPTHQQDASKRSIGTSLAIRLVLDRAGSTQEAVDILRQYNMLATNGRDYHFYITDATGDGRVVEWDCLREDHALMETPMTAITNFYAAYTDSVLSHQRNGIFGHGKERYDIICNVLSESEHPYSYATAWEALKEASTAPNPAEVTSNTQWSVVYNLEDLSAQIVLHRHWEDLWVTTLSSTSLSSQSPYQTHH